MDDADTQAAAMMLLALAAIPPEKRLATLALVMKVFVERPTFIELLRA